MSLYTASAHFRRTPAAAFRRVSAAAFRRVSPAAFRRVSAAASARFVTVALAIAAGTITGCTGPADPSDCSAASNADSANCIAGTPTPTATAVTAEAHFCPQDDCAQTLIDQLDAAKTTAHIAIYTFTSDSISRAVLDAHQRGVDVMVLVDGESDDPDTGYSYSTIQSLRNAGIPCRDDGNSSIMHNKYTVIDGRVVLTGSFNYTYSADTGNNENLLLLTSSELAASYEADFQRLWAAGH